MIPDPRVEPTLDVETGGRLCGLGRSKAYEQARRWLDTDGAEGLPCVRFGRTLRVPTAAVLRLLHLDSELPEANEPPVGAGGSHLNVVTTGLPSHQGHPRDQP